jgi:chromosome segregation ATPase
MNSQETKPMLKIITTICLLVGGCMLAGCVDIKADASGMGKGNENSSASAPPPASDARSASELQRDNAQLRQQLATLEKDRVNWQQAIDRQKDEIAGLKQQRDDLKKDRDRYKKAFKKSED